MIYITGSSGYIGSSLCKKLQKINISFDVISLQKNNFEKKD